MAKPIPKIYETILAEYGTGQYTVAELAKKYKIKRATLASYISKNEIKISNNVANGINDLKKGIIALQQEAKDIEISNISNIEKERKKNALLKGFEFLENYGEFGAFAIGLIKKGLAKGSDMLDIAETPEEFAQAMRGIKTGTDALGLFPRSPLVAIQQNINKEVNQKIQADCIEVKVSFVESKKSDDIIDVETADE